jgi:hypothetical protein
MITSFVDDKRIKIGKKKKKTCTIQILSYATQVRRQCLSWFEGPHPQP